MMPRWQASPGFVVAAVLACPCGSVAQTYEPNGDIWKCRVPIEHPPAECAGEDVMGLVAGKHIGTDCSVNVVKSGKIYCSTAAASQTFFKYAPNTNLKTAQEN